MHVYKFGGASIVDAKAIINLKNILLKTQDVKKVVVVSAMGKTTNAMEDVLENYISKNEKYRTYLLEIREYHIMVTEELFDKSHPIKFKLFALFDKIEAFCANNTSSLYGYIYDQIISVGELASTMILSEYLNQEGLANKW